MPKRTIEFEVIADTDRLKRSLGAGGAQVEKFGKQARKAGDDATVGEKGLKRYSVGLHGMGAAVKVAGAAFIGSELVSGVKDLAKASADSEASQARMVATLKASGVSYQAHAARIDEVIQKTSKLSALDDEDLQDAFTNIVRSTGSVSKGLKDVGLAADIATAKHIDVAKAGQLLGKVAVGNTSALARYGIQIDKNASASQAMAVLQQKFGGQAEAFGKTSAGAYARFGVATENLKETLGGALAPALSFTANQLSKLMDDMQSGVGVGGKVTTAFNAIRTAVVTGGQAIRDFAAREHDTFARVGEDITAVGKVATQVFDGFILPTLRRILPGIRQALGGLVTTLKGFAEVIDGIIHGDIGQIFRGLGSIVTGALRTIVGAFRTITSPLREAASQAGQAIWSGIKSGADAILGLPHTIANWVRSGLGDLAAFFQRVGVSFIHAIVGGIKSVPGAIGGAVKSVAKGALGLVGVGDGIGKRAVPALPSAGVASGSLMGANSALSPFARLAATDGLHVSSGTNHSRLTSSGNVSFHSTGEAIDLANGRGPDAAKMTFFRQMQSRFGGRLAELIYGPAQVGIKNGQPFNFGPALNAQHMDHVHVALDLGAPGPGIGGAASYKATGDGHGRFTGDGFGHMQLERLWTQAGGPAGSADVAAAVAQAESGGRSGASNRNTNGSIDRGLWQINSVHGAQSTFDVAGNARAAVAISERGRNWRPWVTFNTGAFRKYLTGSNSGATSGSSGAASSGGAGAVGRLVGGALGSGRTVSGGMTSGRTVVGQIGAGLAPKPVPWTTDTSSSAGGDSAAGNSSDGGITPGEQAIVDSNKDLADAMQRDADARDAAAAAIKDLKASIDQQNAFASSVTAITGAQVARALADFMSGQIVGVDLQGRAQTAGAGTVVRYACCAI